MSRKRNGLSRYEFSRKTGFAAKTVAKMIENGEIEVVRIGDMIRIKASEPERILRLFEPSDREAAE